MPPEVIEKQEDDSLRDSINAALDTVDESGESYEETPQEIDQPVDETDIDDTGETEKPVEKDASVDSDSDRTAAKSGDTDDSVSGDEPTGQQDSIKAPIDWSPKEREDWSKIPRHLQEKVMAREKELNTMLQTTADARRTSDSFNQLTNHFAPVLATLQGETPMDKMAGLVNTVAQLRMGSPIQKAAIMAELINDFGVDIHTLDSALVGSEPPIEVQQNSHIEQLLNERLAPFEQLMGQQNAYQQQQIQQSQEAAINEVIEFGKTHEFLADVRNDMADLIDTAAKHGINMTMEDAYNKACSVHPEISKVLEQRAQQEKLLGEQQTIGQKKLASSSVTGRQGGQPVKAENLSLRDEIAASWDNQNKL